MAKTGIGNNVLTSVTLSEELMGIKPFNISNIGRNIILVGPNGSGKTRILKIIGEKLINQRQSMGQLSICYSTPQSPVALTYWPNPQKDIVEKIDMLAHSVIDQAPDNVAELSFKSSPTNIIPLLQYCINNKDRHLLPVNEFLSRFLLTNLTCDNANTIHLFDRSINLHELSDGQKVLLQIAVMLYWHFQVDAKKHHSAFNGILLIDEPEAHLHPAIAVEILNFLREKLPLAQFWIATHSLAITAMFEAEEIWYCENGCITAMRSNSEQVLAGMMGHKESQRALWNMMALPLIFTSNKFAAECLLAPKAAAGTHNDPQTQQAINLLKKTCKEDQITVIDYGAGKGRLLTAFMEHREAMSKINYFAYDYAYNQDCQTVLKEAYPNDHKERYYQDLDTLVNKGIQADAVYLINVLHEMPPGQWVSLFQCIVNLLKQDGHLFIIENEELTYGEKAYDQGFLVFGESSFKKMFRTNNFASFYCDNKPHLAAHVVSKDNLYKVNEESIINAIGALKQDAILKIEDLRQLALPRLKDKESPCFKAGIKHAFWIHQLANATMYLELLKDCPRALG